MTNIKKNYKLFFILLLFWMLFTSSFDYLNFIAGITVCLIVTSFSHNILYTEKGFVFKSIGIGLIIKYFFNLMLEIYKSSFSYMAHIIHNNCEPCIEEIELDVTDPLIITIISNSITLTPGTLTVNVDGSRFTVLALKNCGDCENTLETEIKEKFEKFFLYDC